MFYLKKNVGGTQRVVRILAGGAMIPAGILMYHGMAAGYVLAGVGAMLLMTGMIGYCPACAMVGHKHAS